MFDRHWLVDLSLAVLLTLPIAAVAKAQTNPHHQSSKIVAAISTGAERSPGGRMSLLG